MARYKQIAQQQHKLIMLIMEKGLKSNEAREALKAYAERVIHDKDFLKIVI